MTPNQHEVAFACEANYGLPLGVALSSLLRHADPQVRIRVWILNLGLTESTRSRIERVVEESGFATSVHWHAARSCDIRGLGWSRHIAPASYLRLLLADVLPGEVERVLYLDSDILVRSDVQPLLSTALRGSPVGAVQDYAVQTTDGSMSPLRTRVAPRPYFNGGVLILDLAEWRRRGIASRVLDYAVENSPLEFADQDAMNAVIDDWRPVDPTWNVQSALSFMEWFEPSEFQIELLRERPRLLTDPRIVHFSGLPKPWQRWCRYPFVDSWLRAVADSGYLSAREFTVWRTAAGLSAP